VAPDLDDPIRFVEGRTGAAGFTRKAMRYLFPDHWSFLVGEVSLYCFIVLVGTGTYIALFFEPSVADTVYHGTYTPLEGVRVSEAYKSVVDMSFNVKAGLLMRQTHHWAADLFLASIVVHLARVFFTGGYRRPRELTWTIGVIMLFVSFLEGYLGYSIVDDLLSGIGLVIGYGALQSVPIVGGALSLWIWGAPFPGTGEFEARMYIAHVFLLPAVIAVLIAAHLALVAARHHTQFRVSKRATERRLIGVPTFPGQAGRSLGLFFAVTAVLVLLGGLVQINPVWEWGPFETALATNGAQPDWYLGWLIGGLRLMPGFDVVIGDYTLIPNAFWGGVLFPIVVLVVMLAYPWWERRRTGDRSAHNLLDRPRDAPGRTAFGVAFTTWVFLIFAAGSADRLTVVLGLSYEGMIVAYRILVWVIPVVLYFVTLRWCRALQRAEEVEHVQHEAEREVAEAAEAARTPEEVA